jgi:hypothetical protein
MELLNDKKRFAMNSQEAPKDFLVDDTKRYLRHIFPQNRDKWLPLDQQQHQLHVVLYNVVAFRRDLRQEYRSNVGVVREYVEAKLEFVREIITFFNRENANILAIRMIQLLESEVFSITSDEAEIDLLAYKDTFSWVMKLANYDTTRLNQAIDTLAEKRSRIELPKYSKKKKE